MLIKILFIPLSTLVLGFDYGKPPDYNNYPPPPSQNYQPPAYPETQAAPRDPSEPLPLPDDAAPGRCFPTEPCRPDYTFFNGFCYKVGFADLPGLSPAGHYSNRHHHYRYPNRKRRELWDPLNTGINPENCPIPKPEEDEDKECPKGHKDCPYRNRDKTTEKATPQTPPATATPTQKSTPGPYPPYPPYYPPPQYPPYPYPPYPPPPPPPNYPPYPPHHYPPPYYPPPPAYPPYPNPNYPPPPRYPPPSPFHFPPPPPNPSHSQYPAPPPVPNNEPPPYQSPQRTRPYHIHSHHHHYHQQDYPHYPHPHHLQNEPYSHHAYYPQHRHPDTANDYQPYRHPPPPPPPPPPPRSRSQKKRRTGITMKEAWEKCRLDGAELASICCHEENSFIRGLVSATNLGAAWFGLKVNPSLQGAWARDFTDNRVCQYRNWMFGKPDNLLERNSMCTIINADGTWDDFNCYDFTYIKLFVCKMAARPPLKCG